MRAPESRPAADRPGSRWQSWLRHPVVPMWRGYEDALALYFWTMVGEWTGRGYRSTIALPRPTGRVLLPPWFGDDRLHASHRSNLLRKDPLWYGRFGWTESPHDPYWWPGRERQAEPGGLDVRDGAAGRDPTG